MSLGKGRDPLVFDLPTVPKWYIRTAEICWGRSQQISYLILTIELKDEVKMSRFYLFSSTNCEKRSPYKKTVAIFVLILQKKSLS